MSDTPNSDDMLPPKLNLSKTAAKPASMEQLPGAGAPTETPDTSRIKLTAKPLQKTTVKPLEKVVQKPAATMATTTATKPVTVLKARKPTGPATVKLKAKPAAEVTTKSEAPTPVVVKKSTPAPAKPALIKQGGGALKAKAPTLTAKPAILKAKPAALKPQTVSLKPKPAVGIKRDGIDHEAPVGSKRSTTKIPLSSSTPPSHGSDIGTKTIKIKPSSEINSLTGKVPIPVAHSITAKKPDPKRQTSRISLDTALGNEKETTGPKTIRLKRPGKTPTVKVNDKVEDDGALSKTSKIELPKDENIPATQKKTIKIKRPSQKRSAKTISVKRSGVEQPAVDTGNADAPTLQPLQPLTKQKAPDAVHWTFISASVAALIIVCVLIYVLCAQVFGPNISLTKLAYAAPDVELPWPGRIER